jgi:hypothetical protein
MKLLKFVTLFTVTALIFACSSVSYKSDFDRDVDFSTYKSYSWYEGKQPEDDLSRNPLVKKRIRESIDKALKDKGFIQTEDSDADFTVVIHAGVKDRMQVFNTGSYGWYDPWWGPYGGRTEVSYYEEGTLVLDVVDSQNKELSWRGTATATVKEHTDAAEMQEYFDEVAVNLLKNFPPQK